MTKKMIALSFATTLFLSLSVTTHAHANDDGYSSDVYRNIKVGKEFTMKVHADGSLFHRSGYIDAQFKTTVVNGKNCGDFSLSGQGRIFRKFKRELEEQAEYDHNEALAELFERENRGDDYSFTVCYRPRKQVSHSENIEPVFSHHEKDSDGDES